MISIITPLYNGERYIAGTINSVLSQTFEHWEMLIVDDGSKDSSAQIVRQYAAQDKKMKEDVETRNQADQMDYQSEKTLNEMGDKIPAEDKSKVQAGIDKLKEALKGTDTQAIKTATESLTQAFYKVSEKMYQQANPQGGQPGPDMGGAGFGGQQAGGAAGGSGNKGPDDVVDADYTVVDDQ